jgi:xanthine dehydrogenase accessory factor
MMVGPFARVRDCLRSGLPVAVATVVALEQDESAGALLPPLGAHLVVQADVETEGVLGDSGLDMMVERDSRVALERGRSVTRRYGPQGQPLQTDVTVFIDVFGPPSKMLIFGAADFSAALVRVAKVLGYYVIVCDARSTFATAARFPEADEVVVEWPQRYLAKVASTLGPSDALCVLTHDHKFDIPALMAALETKVGYIGAMGSRKTHQVRAELLRAEGADPERIGHIMSPIGLDIGARTPEETAISICAEIISLRAQAGAPSLRDTSGPIHPVTS